MGGEASVSAAPKPMWAVALDKMRAADGGRPDSDVKLAPVEAQAFVEHYLHTSRLLDVTEDALRERNARLGLIERLTQGKPVTYPSTSGPT